MINLERRRKYIREYKRAYMLRPKISEQEKENRRNIMRIKKERELSIRTIYDIRNMLKNVEPATVPLALIKHPDRPLYAGLKSTRLRKGAYIARRIKFRAGTKQYKREYYRLINSSKILKNVKRNIPFKSGTKEYKNYYNKLRKK